VLAKSEIVKIVLQSECKRPLRHWAFFVAISKAQFNFDVLDITGLIASVSANQSLL
jgi:hypothetical protein